jgi:HPr kinase/phosphorylase
MSVPRSLTARDLFDDLHDRMQLRWVAGEPGQSAPSISADALTARPAAAGFLNLIHPNRIQVLGRAEIDYLDALSDSERRSTIERMFRGPPLAIVIGDGLDIPGAIAREAADKPTALMDSGLPAHELVNFLQYYISRSLAARTTLHGVFMEIFTIGVLISGDAGCGKSELALELLNRGHRLIADDAPEFTQISPDIIDGTCPEALQDCLEVRGLGVLNVRQMFGDAAVKANKFLRLIIHLEYQDPAEGFSDRDRLHGDTSSAKVLELDIPRITLPVMTGRNLATLAEAAVRDFMLKMKGYDAASAFVERHAQLMRRQERRRGS